jgi:hypothetical protein
VKKICLSVFLLLFINAVTFSQRRNDTAFHAIKMSKEDIKTVPIRLLPQDYYAASLGFFCKKEILTEKALKFPVKFRLGSVAYCDAIEGKNRNYIPPNR